MSDLAESKPGEVQAAVLYAITRAGYRHIDCAAIYENEGEVGAALTEAFTKWDIKREEVRRKLLRRMRLLLTARCARVFRSSSRRKCGTTTTRRRAWSPPCASASSC